MAEKKEKRYVSDNAQLMAEWHWEKNNELGFNPQKLTCGSGKEVWWKCKNTHEWKTSIDHRNSGSGCPYCSGKRAIKGKNDLQTINPNLAKEWNYEKNNDLTPSNVLPNSNAKAWWKCDLGHEWQASIANRNRGANCPYCTSKKVLIGFNDLQTTNPLLAKEWDYEKNIELTPRDVMPSSGIKVWWKCIKGHEWRTTVSIRSTGHGCPICNSEQKTSFPEYAIVYYLKKYGLNVLHSYKEQGYELDVYIPSLNIAIEYDGYYWHKGKTKKDLEKNRKCLENGIILYRIREGLAPLNDSSKDYIVQKNQTNLAEILQQCLCELIGTNVDIDLERDAIEIANLQEFTEKKNSLLFLNLQIANEWNYKKNGKITPENVSANSKKKVWWKCNIGHEWQASIASRNGGRGCPYCSSRKILSGYNDLLTINPMLSEEWNYDKNIELTPQDVMPNSKTKVWWKCNNGHEWQASIASRHGGGNGCPYCSGRKVLSGYNDLQTLNPTLANDWDYESNFQLTPLEIRPNSRKKLWWKCDRGHKWQATANDRNHGSGCPYCAGRYAIKGENDLQTLNPSLISEWNYYKNGNFKPEHFTANSSKKVWWICENGHEWAATINNRSRGSGCPVCYKEKFKEKNKIG